MINVAEMTVSDVMHEMMNTVTSIAATPVAAASKVSKVNKPFL